MVRDVNKLINMEIMERPEDGIRAKQEIILTSRPPLVLDLGLHTWYYFRVEFGYFRYIYGNRYPKEIFNQCQSGELGLALDRGQIDPKFLKTFS